MSTTGERFERTVAIMERLRAPGGCPWDREQTFDSIKPYTLEETYEVLEAIDNRDWAELAGELGDLLLQVVFYSEMAKEQGSFSIDDVLDRLSTKLVDRHPHVFGDVKADTSAKVLRNWEALKAEERKKKSGATGDNVAHDRVTESAPKAHDDRHSVLAGVSSAMPSLLDASKRRSATCSSCWLILHVTCRSILSPHCVGQIGNSNDGSNGWNSNSAKAIALPRRYPWKSLNHFGSKRSSRRSRCEPWPRRDSPLPRLRRTARVRCAAERRMELHRR